jgi:hypothetical protein
VSVLWWDATCGRDEPSFEIVIRAEKRQSKEETEEYLPVLRDWFERLAPNLDELKKGIQRMLTGCFDWLEENRPYIDIDPDKIEYETHQNYPRVVIPVASDLQFIGLDKKDERVRWVWSEIFTSGMFLNIADDGYGSQGQDLRISSLKLNFDDIAAGGIQVARELGLDMHGAIPMPPIWRKPPDSTQYDDAQICIRLKEKTGKTQRTMSRRSDLDEQKASGIAAIILAAAFVEGAVDRALGKLDPTESAKTKTAFEKIMMELKMRTGMDMGN